MVVGQVLVISCNQVSASMSSKSAHVMHFGLLSWCLYARAGWLIDVIHIMQLICLKCAVNGSMQSVV